MSYTSQIPTLDAAHVYATSEYSANFHAYFACDPSKPLTGAAAGNSWASQNYAVTNQNIFIVYGSGKIIKRIYYENYYWGGFGGSQFAGVRLFTFWGSNDGINWVQLVVSQPYFVKHVNADAADPQYITVDNATSYIYHCFLFKDNHGSESFMGVRRIELQTEDTFAPTVTTTSISSPTETTAEGGGNVTADGGAAVTDRGVCWKVGGVPVITDSHLHNGSGTGAFASSLTGLTASTHYHIRAFATNSVGTSYGADVEFDTNTTPPPPPTTAPTVTTTAISAITNIAAASGGDCTHDGGDAVTAKGVCWSTSPNPIITDSKTSNGTGEGAYASSITGLSAGIVYYVRAYATNGNGTSYGSQESFITDTVPTVVTAAVTAIADTTATCGGNVTADNGDAVTARGVCWNTQGSPTISDSKTTDGSGTGVFVSSLAGLTCPTIYYVRAYATNAVGTSYGIETSFLTITVPTVTTTSPATGIKDTLARVRGEIISTGGVAPTVRGVCYNTTGTPTTADSKIQETGTFGTGSFSETLTPLTRSTHFYARAFCTNTQGTTYGTQIEFTTLSVESIAEPQLSLQDTYYLNRAGRYADYLNSNDRLPFVYGDLTDGTAGIWQLPCIDTVNFVYCFAAFPVLSVANGNSINIYADGVLVAPANYAFDEDNDYESEGQIATITFTTDRANAVITARGKGKPTTAGGATLMTNIIDTVSDFLTVQNNFTSDLFEATAKAKATQVFTAEGYAAAGVIADDGGIWDIIIEMMASFLGSAYLNGSGELVLEIDDGTMSLYGATIIRKGEAVLMGARQRLVNIINQCPAHYAYSYSAGEFKRETNTSAHVDALSQGVHGVREPNTPLQLYWCRNITNAQAIQDIIVTKFKDPIYEIEIEDESLKHLHLDVGDHFIYSVDSLYDKTGEALNNHYWRTVSVRPDFSKAKIGFRALQTPHYFTMAYLLDGSFELDGPVQLGANRNTVTY